MAFIIFASLLGLALIIAILATAVTKEPGAFFTAVGLGIVLIVITVFSSVTTVGARAVGIQTSFGKYDSTLSSGFHWTKPWSGVEEFPTLVQTLDLDNTDGNKGGNVAVAYQGGGDGGVNLTVRWRIDTEDAQELWRNYRTFDAVSEQLVKNTARASTKATVGKYTPSEARDGNNLRKIESDILADLNTVLSSNGIKIESVSVIRIDLGEQAQRAVDRIVEANANTERAKSEQERAKIDAETAKLRSVGGSLTPEALQRYCYEVTNAWDVGKNGPLPATWNCAASGSPTAIIVGQAPVAAPTK